MIALLFLLALLTPPAPPPTEAGAHVAATWLNGSQVRVTWEGGNLYRVVGPDDVFLAAAPGGSLILPFGPPSDNNYVPRPGDRYVVRDAQSGQDVAETTLGWPSVRWLPMLLR